MISKMVEKYAEIIARNPWKVLILSLLAVGVLTAGASKVETEDQDVNDFLPDKYAPVEAFDTIDAEFGSAEATTYTILLETRPRYANSTEIRDVRDPRFLRYTEKISREAEEMERVSSISSPSNLFQDIPPTQREVEKTLDTLGEARWQQYLTEDYSAGRIQIEAIDLTPEEQKQLAKDIRYAVESTDKPSGVQLTYTGQTYIDQAFQNQSGNTMSTTSTVAFTLVLVIVILLFRSITNGLISLEALLFGIMAGYGTFGWLGFNLSPSTSGAISIGIGIAVDFGIQPVARYREERKKENNGQEKSLEKTLKGIYRPMTLGMIAAIMGFSALSLGDITFLSSLGTILSLTTFMAYMAAFTIIPPTLIIHDKYITGKIPSFQKLYYKVKTQK